MRIAIWVNALYYGEECASLTVISVSKRFTVPECNRKLNSLDKR